MSVCIERLIFVEKPQLLKLEVRFFKIYEWQPWPFIKHCIPEMFFLLHSSSNVPYFYLLFCIWLMKFNSYHIIVACVDDYSKNNIQDSWIKYQPNERKFCTLYTRTKLILNLKIVNYFTVQAFTHTERILVKQILI